GILRLETGDDSFGTCWLDQLGNGSCHEDYRWNLKATPLPNSDPVLDLSIARDSWLCMARADGRVECRDRDHPGGRLIENINTAVDVELGASLNVGNGRFVRGGCALDAHGQLSCWNGDDGVAERQAEGHHFHQLVLGRNCNGDEWDNIGWCLLDRDGTVWALLDGQAQEQNVFPDRIQQLAGGSASRRAWVITCALSEAGAVFCLRGYGPGAGRVETIDELGAVEEITAAFNGGCAWGRDQSIYCWGANQGQRVQAGAEGLYVDRPVRVEGLPAP
ncbi:MAG TPA: hypothetical protein DEB46_14560, partial [Myxococcales bacterium]|nr:hypothetical protein [Myxococcales bacterium]